MPITFDITQSAFYKEGRAKGKQQGLEQGLEKKEKEMIISMLEEGMDHVTIARIAKVDVSFVREVEAEMKRG